MDYKSFVQGVVSDEEKARAILEKAANSLTEEERYIFEEILCSTNELITRDELTGLLRKAAFEHQLKDTVSKHKHGYLEDDWLVYMDLDDFKNINDNHGHHYGDALLSRLGKLWLPTEFRPTDAIGRIGGDEFGAIMYKIDETLDGVKVKNRLEQIVGNIESHIAAMGTQYKNLSLSVGAAALLFEETPESAKTRADDALYLSKSLKHHMPASHRVSIWSKPQYEAGIYAQARKEIENGNSH